MNKLNNELGYYLIWYVLILVVIKSDINVIIYYLEIIIFYIKILMMLIIFYGLL